MRFRLASLASLTLVSLLFSAPAAAEEPLPVERPVAAAPPPSDLPPPSARATHIVAGATTTAVSYGLALGASLLLTEDDYRGAKSLRVPIAGPWLALGKTGCPTPDCNAFGLVIGTLLTLFDGVAQAGGLAVIGEGLFLKTSSARPVARKAEGPTVRAVPLNFEKGGVGLGVVGMF